MKRLLFALLVLSMLTTVSCTKDKLTSQEKTYTAISSQSGTSAPIITELNNTIGDVEWTYISTGVYRGTLTGAFPVNKTFSVCNNGVDGYVSADVRHYSDDFIELRTFAGLDNFGNPKPSDGCDGIRFEVRVY